MDILVFLICVGISILFLVIGSVRKAGIFPLCSMFIGFFVLVSVLSTGLTTSNVYTDNNGVAQTYIIQLGDKSLIALLVTLMSLISITELVFIAKQP